MNRWAVTREQWVAWIEQGPGPSAPASVPLDAVDAQLLERLSANPFVVGEEETISRPELSGGQPFDSMTTMVRSAVGGAVDGGATRVRPEPQKLEVGLQAPEAGLEVGLEPSEELPTIISVPSAAVREAAAAFDTGSTGGSIGGSTGGSTGAPTGGPAGNPAGGSMGAASAEPERTVIATTPTEPVGQTVVAPAPSAPESEDDGLFIPTLTRTVVETSPGPVPESLAPPPATSTGGPVPPTVPPVVPSVPVGPAPSAQSPEPALAEVPAISGDTVIGPPPAPPESMSPGSSTASGLIQSSPDTDEAAQTLTRGEIPGDGARGPLIAPTSKVVIASSANGMMGSVYDEEEPDDEPTVIEVEPQELDAEDLVEEDDGPEPEPLAPIVAPTVEESGPPPAPARPPAASRPPVEVGPPPPPVSSSSLDAAMAALPVAPAMDEGWQVDAFAEHYAALLPVQRASVVTAEVDFILHCAGLSPGATVLDMGCGDGAHGVVMASRGLAVTGLDASPSQLMRASQSAQSMGLSLNLVAGDMRQPPIDTAFDGIVCLGGTLGLFGDEDDRLALQNMRDRLKPGGRLMLHVLNREYIAGRLPARSWWQGQGCLVLDEAQMFAPTSRLHVHRTIVFETGTQFEHNIGLRVYGLTELVHMCAQVGLQVLEFSGSRHTRGRFYGATSSEIWLLAQRPAA